MIRRPTSIQSFEDVRHLAAYACGEDVKVQTHWNEPMLVLTVRVLWPTVARVSRESIAARLRERLPMNVSVIVDYDPFLPHQEIGWHVGASA